MNFKTIRNFIARMVSVFDISPDKVQIGNVLIRPRYVWKGLPHSYYYFLFIITIDRLNCQKIHEMLKFNFHFVFEPV